LRCCHYTFDFAAFCLMLRLLRYALFWAFYHTTCGLEFSWYTLALLFRCRCILTFCAWPVYTYYSAGTVCGLWVWFWTTHKCAVAFCGDLVFTLPVRTLLFLPLVLLFSCIVVPAGCVTLRAAVLRRGGDFRCVPVTIYVTYSPPRFVRCRSDYCRYILVVVLVPSSRTCRFRYCHICSDSDLITVLRVHWEPVALVTFFLLPLEGC